MKKLALSIALMSVIIIGGSAVTFAAETNEDVDTTEVTTSTEEITSFGNTECPYYDENNRGVGNPECPYYEENYNKENAGSRNTNRCGKSAGNQGNRKCDGSRNRMMNGRNN